MPTSNATTAHAGDAAASVPRPAQDRPEQGRATVPFAPPSIGEPEIDEVVAVLKSGWLTTGARVRAFEEAFAAYVGAPHAIAVNSCTAALHLSLLAARVGAGDEVITTPLTFCATANTIIHCGATPVFVDVDPLTGNIDARKIEAAITVRTKAIIPVHYAGRPADAAAIGTIASHHGLTVIDDAAHAVEARSTVGKVGATAHFTCFSFYATKNLTTGEGGMVTLRSTPQADWIRTASLHGLSRDAWARYTPGGRADYDVVMPGFKYNMMDIQAALGLHQLARIEAHLRAAQRHLAALRGRACGHAAAAARAGPVRHAPRPPSLHRARRPGRMRDQPQRPPACAAGARHRHQRALQGLAPASLLCGAPQAAHEACSRTPSSSPIARCRCRCHRR